MESPSLIRIDTLHQERQFEGTPKVGVLMSTYNGAQYIDEQISTIASQEGVSVSVTIRDDGSSDETSEIAKDSLNRHLRNGSEYSVYSGRNLGFLGSFEELLLHAKGCNYYAFSDQDDLWKSCKLSKAVTVLDPYKDQPAIYASSVSIANEKLQFLSKNNFPHLKYSFAAEIIRHRLAGHTMVWNEAMQKRIREYGTISAWCHDQHVILAGLLNNAPLIMDSASYVMHRRLETSVTPGGNSMSKRLRHEWSLMMNRGNKFNRQALAARLLELSDDAMISEEDRRILLLTAKRQYFPLFFDSSFGCGLVLGDIEARFSMLIGRF